MASEQKFEPSGVLNGFHPTERWPALHLAAFHGNAADVASLLTSKADVEETVSRWEDMREIRFSRQAYRRFDHVIALHLAAATGSIECIKLLLGARADASARIRMQPMIKGEDPRDGPPWPDPDRKEFLFGLHAVAPTDEVKSMFQDIPRPEGKQEWIEAEELRQGKLREWAIYRQEEAERQLRVLEEERKEKERIEETKRKELEDIAAAKVAREQGIIEDGRQRGVEIKGAAESGGPQFFCTLVDERVAGDLTELAAVMEIMNEESGHVGKMIFSACDEMVAIVAYVPESKKTELSCEEWLEAVVEEYRGEVLSRGVEICTGCVRKDIYTSVVPPEILEPMMRDSRTFLRQVGLVPTAD